MDTRSVGAQWANTMAGGHEDDDGSSAEELWLSEDAEGLSFYERLHIERERQRLRAWKEAAGQWSQRRLL